MDNPPSKLENLEEKLSPKLINLLCHNTIKILSRCFSLFFFDFFSVVPQKPNRQSDYYDISPRPFGVPAGAGPAASAGSPGAASLGAGATSASVTNGFTRSKAIRNGPGGSGNSLTGGYQPQTQRINVPHQQTQFLAHFNENGVRKCRLMEVALWKIFQFIK